MKEFYGRHMRGMKTEDFVIRENTDGSTVIGEISYYMGDYGYSYMILDTDGNIVYDESDGGSLLLCRNRINEVDKINYWNPKFCYVVEWVDKKTPKLTFLNKETGKTYDGWFDFYEKENIDTRYVSAKDL